VRSRRGVTAVLACFTGTGLVGAHVVAYLIALPDAAVRATILRATGHGYFSVAMVVATVAAIFGSFAPAALGFRRGETARVAVRWRYAAVRIALVQTAAFVVLGFAERAAANVPPVAMSPRLLFVGIGVQVLVACLAAAVIAVICRVAALVRRALSTGTVRVLRPALRFVHVFEAALPQPALVGGFDSRAPPVSPR